MSGIVATKAGGTGGRAGVIVAVRGSLTTKYLIPFRVKYNSVPSNSKEPFTSGLAKAWEAKFKGASPDVVFISNLA